MLQSDMAGLDEDVKGYEDWRALCGGDGDGLSVINEVLQNIQLIYLKQYPYTHCAMRSTKVTD
jgi:methylase of polypeptide subunit release factors